MSIACARRAPPCERSILVVYFRLELEPILTGGGVAHTGDLPFDTPRSTAQERPTRRGRRCGRIGCRCHVRRVC